MKIKLFMFCMLSMTSIVCFSQIDFEFAKYEGSVPDINISNTNNENQINNIKILTAYYQEIDGKWQKTQIKLAITEEGGIYVISYYNPFTESWEKPLFSIEVQGVSQYYDSKEIVKYFNYKATIPLFGIGKVYF